MRRVRKGGGWGEKEKDGKDGETRRRRRNKKLSVALDYQYSPINEWDLFEDINHSGGWIGGLNFGLYI